MFAESKCELCKYGKVKNKFFGGKKIICSIQKREVKNIGTCSEFVGDGDKVLQYAVFRPRDPGNPNDCSSCVYREGSLKGAKTIYLCKKHNVQFWPGYSPLKYICDDWKDGGMDALISCMADFIIEANESTKN